MVKIYMKNSSNVILKTYTLDQIDEMLTDYFEMSESTNHGNTPNYVKGVDINGDKSIIMFDDISRIRDSHV